jgi:L-gulonolactone oxidase
MGVITRVTLRVVEAFGLEERTRVVGLDEALESLVDVANEEEFVKWFWLPHTGRVAEYRYRRVDRASGPARFARWLDAKLVNGLVFPTVLALGGAVPSAIPAINRAVRVAYFRPGVRSGRSDHMFNLAMPPVHRETEWSVPLEQGPEAARRIARSIEGRGLRVNFIQELRLVRGDSAWLSPAHGRDSCHVGAYIGHGRDAEPFITGSSELMQELGARPHWGKEMRVGPDYLAAVYPQIEQFLDLRSELDPGRTFDNDFLRRSFGVAADT